VKIDLETRISSPLNPHVSQKFPLIPPSYFKENLPENKNNNPNEKIKSNKEIKIHKEVRIKIESNQNHLSNEEFVLPMHTSSQFPKSPTIRLSKL